MSLIVSTNLGRFREVVDGADKKAFLFECPECLDWLPMSEAHLSGSRDIQHFRRDGRVCRYFAAKQYGAALVSTMQARILIEEKPYDTDRRSLELGE